MVINNIFVKVYMSKFEKMIGYKCGTAMVGIKSAGLMCCRLSEYANIREELDAISKKLSGSGIEIKILFDDGERIMFLVYRTAILKSRLESFEYAEFLKDIGYPIFGDLERMLDYLSFRCRKDGGFPHEIGVFLGYPLADIKGFICDPQACKHVGFWKVYHNVEQTKVLFERYKKCAGAILQRMDRGEDLGAIFARGAKNGQ